LLTKKIVRRIAILVVPFLILVVLLFYLGKQYHKSALTLVVNPEINIDIPTRIKIPSIGVNAPIEGVGITKSGLMDVPKLPFDTGWYNLGPRPGETGSAVLDGHVNWRNGKKAVFADLSNLKPGDKVMVQNYQGTTTTFIVHYNKIYKASATTKDIFTSSDKGSHLNLITCSGTWDTLASAYSQRLVIFTDKEVSR
jgi:sortase A